MIELHVQPSRSILPGLPEAAQIGAPEGADFQSQLAQLTSLGTVVDGGPDGIPLPPSGKALPEGPGPVIINLFEVPPPPVTLLEMPTVPDPKTTPIMRPLAARAKHAAALQLDAEPVVAAPENAAEPPAPLIENRIPVEVAESAVPLPPAVPVLATANPDPLPTAPSRARLSEAPPPVVHPAVVQPQTVNLATTNPVTRLTSPAPATAERPAITSGQLPKPDPRQPHTAIAKPVGLALEPLPARVQIAAAAMATASLASALVLPGTAAQPPRSGDPRRRTPAPIQLKALAESTRAVRINSFELPPLASAKTIAVQPVLADLPVNLTVAPAAPLTGPDRIPTTQDFAALIDRLVAAREASGAPVAVALRHIEFGPVTLRFEQGDGGLTVAASSPDPDFARAAVMALPAERPVSAEQAPRDSGKAPAQGETATGSGHSSQSRHSTPTAPGTPARNRPANVAPDSEVRDGGIFA